MFERKRALGVVVGTGALILGTLTVASASVAGEMALVFDRVGDPDDIGAWVRTGDVLRFRVRLAGEAQDARLAVATSPGEALSTVTCTPQSLAAGVPVAAGAPLPIPTPSTPPGAAESALTDAAGSARTDGGSADGPGSADGRAAGALGVPQVDGTLLPGAVPTPGVGVAARGAEVCRLGKVSGERAVDVRLTVPQGVNEVVLAAVAQVWGNTGVSTLSRTARTPVGSGPMPRPGETVVLPLPTPATAPAPAQEPGKPVQIQQPGKLTRPSGDSSYTGPRGALTNVGPRSARGPQGTDAGTRDTDAGTRAGTTGPRPRDNAAPRNNAAPLNYGALPGDAAPRGGAVSSGVSADARQPGSGQGVWDDPNVRLPHVAPLAAGVQEGVGAPWPRHVAVAGRTFGTAAKPMNMLTGYRGLSVAAGGIALLLVALWFVARAQRRRIAGNQD
ncbi:hypothetical protein ACIBEJ_31800 [Nonomuraea sp. NPDC050790]|uniref:hypothetical protein n=1 Tax=Nonomuraea sp. NPDC050790 TaxID=3364371 RepID=UPI0037A3DEFB